MSDSSMADEKHHSHKVAHLERYETHVSPDQQGEIKRHSIDGAFVPPTAAEEAAVIRKLDWRLLPFVLVLYSLSILDRSNLGNAKLAGMTKAINLTGLRYNWLGTIFYIAYILFQWQTSLWKQFKPHIWATWCILFWGIISTVQAATHNWTGLMFCRFLLGIAEAGFGPGVPLYLTFFYPKDKIGLRQGVFISGAALANAYGGALAYGITQIKGSIGAWKILFLIEGLPTICLAPIAFFFLPDSISSAKFLTDREKAIAAHIVARNQTLDEGHKDGLRSHELLAGFMDLKSYLPALMYFGINVSYASLPLFTPTIISEIGKFTTIQSQGLSSPPYILAFFTILFSTFASDRLRLRGPFVAFWAIVAAIGFILLGTSKDTSPRYAGVFLAITIFTCVPLVLCWVANIHSTESKRAGGYVVLATIGQCGPVLGTNLFPSTEAPYYRKGMWVSCGMCLMVAVCAIILSVWLHIENRQMERKGLLRSDNEIDIREEGEEGVKKYKYVL